MGIFVPAWTGQRVVYGHPFETVNADQRQKSVEAYWSGDMSAADQNAFLRQNRVRYLLVGPREQAIGAEERFASDLGDLVLQAGDTGIYSINEN